MRTGHACDCFEVSVPTPEKVFAVHFYIILKVFPTPENIKGKLIDRDVGSYKSCFIAPYGVLVGS